MIRDKNGHGGFGLERVELFGAQGFKASLQAGIERQSDLLSIRIFGAGARCAVKGERGERTQRW